MSETDLLVKQREQEFFKLISSEPSLRNFAIFAGISLVFALFAYIGLINVGSFHFILLFLAFVLGAILWHYKQFKLVFYPILAWIVWISTIIRIRPLPGLRDVTTGGWTLGPDLDPFLFLRWAKEIVANGSLANIDLLRSAPLGFPSNEELVLHSYLIAYFHKIVSLLGISSSVDQSAVLFPVFIFGLGAIFFFLFVKEVFMDKSETKASIIASISTLFFVLLPQILPRTIAGIPEKEASSMPFMFATFYFFLLAWKSEKSYARYGFALLAGLSTALMALVWGGYLFVVLPISLAITVAFFWNQVDFRKFLTCTVWIVSAYLIMTPFSTRYAIANLLNSTTSLIPLAVLGLCGAHLLFENTNLKKYVQKIKWGNLPPTFRTFVITAIFAIVLVLVLRGPSFIVDKFNDITKPLITPISDRFGVTVAENRQPYFAEWANGFGPMIGGFPVFFWMFIVGSALLVWRLIESLPKAHRYVVTGAYSVFVLAIIYSRYSSSSLFNGVNFASIATYILGALVFFIAVGWSYYKLYSVNELYKLKELSFPIVLVISLFFLSLVSARGAIRLVLMLVPAASILAAYCIVFPIERRVHEEREKKVVQIGFFILLILGGMLSSYYFYQVSYQTATGYVPSLYTQQWQRAMAWVRESTPINSVFVHWWDYGYWVQTMGERATVVDGGNYIVYWDYLVGREVLTNPDLRGSLNFSYAHNVSHLLIDSTDIGKYSAFASIGSDANYDRASWITAFYQDESQVQETKNSTLFLFTGGTGLDSDITYNLNGSEIFLPGGRAGLSGIILEKNASGDIIKNPVGVFVNNGKQYLLPLRYAFKNKLIDFGTGIDAGVFVAPQAKVENNQLMIKPDGVMLYLSSRTVHSLFARLYLYNEPNPYYTLVHSEDNEIVSNIKQVANVSYDFISFNGDLQGPIKIWKVNYPKDMVFNKEYLRTTYPDPSYTRVLEDPWTSS